MMPTDLSLEQESGHGFIAVSHPAYDPAVFSHRRGALLSSAATPSCRNPLAALVR